MDVVVISRSERTEDRAASAIIGLQHARQLSYGHELLQCGYHYGAPSSEVEELDAKIIEGGHCKRCGGRVHYEGYHNDTSYIALAVCDQCGREEEF